MAEVPDVSIAAVDVRFGLLDGHVVSASVPDRVFARSDVPLAPRGDDFEAGRDGLVRQLETHLIVAFPRAAVRQRVGAHAQPDFGLTLGHYGVPAGPYVVLPLLGPSTVRDTAGTVVDYFGSVTSYVDPAWFRTTLFGVQLVNTRANLLGAGDVLSGAALDKYSFVRNAYLQRRQYLLGGDGSASGSTESLPKYEDVGAAPAPSATAAPAVAASGSETASGAAAASEPGATSVPPDRMVPPRIPSFPSFKLR